jgi:hypothetical protein
VNDAVYTVHAIRICFSEYQMDDQGSGHMGVCTGKVTTGCLFSWAAWQQCANLLIGTATPNLLEFPGI